MADDWGRLPDAVRGTLHAREWANERHLAARLAGRRRGPVREALRPPTDAQALEDLGRLDAFVAAWERHEAANGAGEISWETRRYRRIGERRLPTHLTLARTSDIIAFLGATAVERARQIERLVAPLLAVDKRLLAALVQPLAALEALDLGDTAQLAKLLPQLRPGLGEGGYLRALPVSGVDTKFVEQHAALIERALDALHDGAVSGQGGLLAWLGCLTTPQDWLWVRALDAAVAERLGGYDVLRLSASELRERALPAARVVIVENAASGYALPRMVDTVAVFGGGRNTAWTAAAWLRERRVAYWGDVDSWGLACLNDVRKSLPDLTALLMDAATVDQHRASMVPEPQPCGLSLPHLREPEQRLYRELRAAVHGRLEQERLDQAWVLAALARWAAV